MISEQPLCAHCEAIDRIKVGTEVDHIDNDPSNNKRSNLMNLCRPCHSAKTRRDQSGSKRVKGCDADGIPLDPAHPWRIAVEREKSPEPADAGPSCRRETRDRS